MTAPIATELPLDPSDFDDAIRPGETGNVVLPLAPSVPRMRPMTLRKPGDTGHAGLELGPAAPPEEPDPQWFRGTCPQCGEKLISNLHFIAGRGYVVRWDCWGMLQPQPRCSYFQEP